MTVNETQRRRNVRRTTLILVAVAMAFYLGFILLGVSRA
jgi:uncharacterized membrane protein